MLWAIYWMRWGCWCWMLCYNKGIRDDHVRRLVQAAPEQLNVMGKDEMWWQAGTLQWERCFAQSYNERDGGKDREPVERCMQKKESNNNMICWWYRVSCLLAVVVELLSGPQSYITSAYQRPKGFQGFYPLKAICHHYWGASIVTSTTVEFFLTASGRSFQITGPLLENFLF